MASMATLRQHNYDDAGPGYSEGRTTRAAMPSRRLVRSLALSFAFAVVVFAAAQLASYGPKTTPTPAFMNLALGAPQPHAPLTRRPASDLSITIRRFANDMLAGTSDGVETITTDKAKGKVETLSTLGDRLGVTSGI